VFAAPDLRRCAIRGCPNCDGAPLRVAGARPLQRHLRRGTLPVIQEGEMPGTARFLRS
jgi:hypothetical protein